MMAEVTYDDLTEEQRKLLENIGQMTPRFQTTTIDTNRLAPLAPPQNFREGLSRVFRRRVLNPVQERLGLRDSLSDLVNRSRLQQNLNQQQLTIADEARRQAMAQSEVLRRNIQDPDQIVSIFAMPMNQLTEMARESVAPVQQVAGAPLGTLGQRRPFGGVDIVQEAPPEAQRLNVYQSLNQEQKQAYDSLNLSEEAQILKSFQGDRDKYSAYLAKSAADKTKAEQLVLQGIPGLDRLRTDAEEAVDKAFGKTYADYTVNGGEQKNQFDLQTYSRIIRQLRANPDLTGPVAIQSEFLNPELVAITQDIQNLVVGNIKRAIGSQVTANEVDQFLSRAFNPRLPAKINADRLARSRELLNSQDKALSAASDHFRKNGTLVGFDTSTLNLGMLDLEAAIYRSDDYKEVSTTDLLDIADQYRKGAYVPEAELKAIRAELERREK